MAKNNIYAVTLYYFFCTGAILPPAEMWMLFPACGVLGDCSNSLASNPFPPPPPFSSQSVGCLKLKFRGGFEVSPPLYRYSERAHVTSLLFVDRPAAEKSALAGSRGERGEKGRRFCRQTFGSDKSWSAMRLRRIPRRFLINIFTLFCIIALYFLPVKFLGKRLVDKSFLIATNTTVVTSSRENINNVKSSISTSRFHPCLYLHPTSSTPPRLAVHPSPLPKSSNSGFASQCTPMIVVQLNSVANWASGSLLPWQRN